MVDVAAFNKRSSEFQFDDWMRGRLGHPLINPLEEAHFSCEEHMIAVIMAVEPHQLSLIVEPLLEGFLRPIVDVVKEVYFTPKNAAIGMSISLDRMKPPRFSMCSPHAVWIVSWNGGGAFRCRQVQLVVPPVQMGRNLEKGNDMSTKFSAACAVMILQKRMMAPLVNTATDWLKEDNLSVKELHELPTEQYIKIAADMLVEVQKTSDTWMEDPLKLGMHRFYTDINRVARVTLTEEGKDELPLFDGRSLYAWLESYFAKAENKGVDLSDAAA
ncbi:uncharacterized protein BCR38DRAFT_406821 [Pseudomassariella vexata]|uniref:Uncharacterized protein n=1 Tax=Pseudomassariella vexata TaxID=1141098 RepID=A0A1Y2ECB8_9PEZI|nr:uncharacterized protein BCR38DRAFT_406821 [Pseudomassariella vexata]ORY68944.1 hypothetical protein BCR38DRAFT_406821 [Pseudomassariella vexata]